MVEDICGIYLITRKDTGQKYIGQSIHINRRFKEHITKSCKNSRIDRAMIKYGRDNFTLKILKCCEPNELDYYEIMYIWLYNTFENNFHYNLTPGGYGMPFGENNPSFKDYPTIQKAGFNNGKQQYFLTFHSKRLIGSYDKNKLQKYIDNGDWIKFYEGTDNKFINKEKKSSIRSGENHPYFIKGIEVDEIINLIKQGKTMIEIADNFNVSHNVIRNRLINNLSDEEYNMVKDLNLKKLSKFKEDNNAWVNLDDKLLYKYYCDDKLSFSEIARKYGVSHNVIKNHIIYYAEKNNLPLKERHFSYYNFKNYPRIIKGGFDENNNQNYVLVYKSKWLKSSIYKEKLEKYVEKPILAENLFNEVNQRRLNKSQLINDLILINYYIESNNIKYFHVSRKFTKKSKTGFYWVYTHNSKPKKSLSSIDIRILKEKVLSKGWVWKEIYR